MTGLDTEEWMKTREAALRSIVGTGDYPHLERILRMDLNLDALFGRGQGLLLDGLGVALDTPQRAAGRPL